MASPHSVPNHTYSSLAALVEEILNFEKGESCFMCQTGHEEECLWTEIGQEICESGNQHIQNCDHGLTEADMHKQARFACYRYYVFVLSEWNPQMKKRIQLPLCIERQIKLTFPGDGNFIGFKEKGQS